MAGSKIGSWAFLIGVILAIIFGFFTMSWVTWVLVILGIVIGLLNITDEEVKPFLYAGAILVIVSALGSNVMGEIRFLGNILENLLAMFVPATIVVALKSVFAIAKK